MKLPKCRRISPSGPRRCTFMSCPGAAWRHRSYSSCRVRTRCSVSTNSRPSRRLISTTAIGSDPPSSPEESESESESKAKDAFLRAHQALALLLLEHLAHGAVLLGGYGQAQRARMGARQQVQHDVGRLPERHAADLRVGQEPAVAPDAVLVEAQPDARGEGHDD